MFLLSWLARCGAPAVTTALLLSGLAGSAHAKEAPTPTPALAEVALSELPAQAQETHRLVLAGGPFPYGKDGVVFGKKKRNEKRKQKKKKIK